MYQAINYKGYKIEVYQDDSPENPFQAWDCLPPIYVNGCGYKKGYELEDTFEHTLSREEIKEHKDKLLEIVESNSLLSFIREYSNTMSTDYSDGVEWFNDSLIEYLNYLSTTDRLYKLKLLYNLVGIPAKFETVHGYSQSSWAEVLVVLTPEYTEKCGIPKDPQKTLKSVIQLYSFWAFGDVYGYQISLEGEENIDSCWGFYGDDIEESGLLEYAQYSIDCLIEGKTKEKQNTIKKLIKSKTPLQYRASRLD